MLPTQSLHFTQQYFDSLPEGDINRAYYEGKRYTPTRGWFSELLLAPLIHQRIETLNKFYPHQRIIKATKTEYDHDSAASYTESLAFTAVAWTAIFGFARYGKVAPLFKEYGSYFKTHRVFRHYLYALIVPLAVSRYLLARKYFPHVEALWTVHVNRLNHKILDEPANTVYPVELRERQRFTF